MFHPDQRPAQLLRQFAVRRKINLVVLENFFVNKGLQKIVNVVAAEVRVAVRRKHLINVAVARGDQLQHGNVERAAAEIINRNPPALLLMQSVSERGSRGLVDQAQNFQSRYFSGILGGLTLRIVEIRRNGDDCAVHGFAKTRFSPIF